MHDPHSYMEKNRVFQGHDRRKKKIEKWKRRIKVG